MKKSKPKPFTAVKEVKRQARMRIGPVRPTRQEDSRLHKLEQEAKRQHSLDMEQYYLDDCFRWGEEYDEYCR